MPLGVSRLLAWCGNFLSSEQGANLAGLLQEGRAIRGTSWLCFP